MKTNEELATQCTEDALADALAEVERLAQRALDAEQGRDRAVAEELQLRTERDTWRARFQTERAKLAVECKGARADERRGIAAWLQYQANLFEKQGDTEDHAAYRDAAMQVSGGAKMIGLVPLSVPCTEVVQQLPASDGAVCNTSAGDSDD